MTERTGKSLLHRTPAGPTAAEDGRLVAAQFASRRGRRHSANGGDPARTLRPVWAPGLYRVQGIPLCLVLTESR